MTEAFETLAQSLAGAWRSSSQIPLPPAGMAPASRADAFAVQDRMHALLGEEIIGWKVGAAIRAVQILEGHDGAIPGRMLASRLHRSPARVPALQYPDYKIESEFAFRFREAVGPRSRPWTRDEIAPMLIFHPGLEIAGSRYALKSGDRKFTTYDAIADNGAGGGYVIGEGIENWTHIDFDSMPVEARIDGGPPLSTYSGEFRLDPVQLVAETVNGLAARGIGLDAGDLLTTGSLTTPTVLHAGQTYVARFGDLMTLSVTMMKS